MTIDVDRHTLPLYGQEQVGHFKQINQSLFGAIYREKRDALTYQAIIGTG